MNKNSKLFSVVGYLTWIGWFIALLARDKSDTLVRRHLNQALVLNVISMVATVLTRLGGILAVIGDVIAIATFVLAIMGIIRAFQMREDPLPLVGGIDVIS
ncbi:MAG: hypothetical protein IJ744_07305 [Lachnospiraceae bacterium]|nr:hypothetical protein [Lachnospiraceae bacterium]